MSKIRVVKKEVDNGPNQNDPYSTRLTPQEQVQYQKWRSKLPKNLQYEGDYDLAGLWKENPNAEPSPNLHFTDKYKKPNHPTFSNESVYFGPKTKKYAGRWLENDEVYAYQPYDKSVKKPIVEKKENNLIKKIYNLYKNKLYGGKD